jgi:hypothetical protein
VKSLFLAVALVHDPVQGIPALNIPSLDPLKIEFMEFSTSSALSGNLTGISIRNSLKGFVPNVLVVE